MGQRPENDPGRSFRQFVSPSLAPVRNTRTTSARWKQSNQVVEQIRKLSFRSGDRMLVNFLQAPQASPAAAK
jgi:hypothetical protein